MSPSHICETLCAQGMAALLPRTPLFGGWSTDFEFGFKLPLGPFQKRLSDGRTQLMIMTGPQVKAITIDDYVIKVLFARRLTLQKPLPRSATPLFRCRSLLSPSKAMVLSFSK